MGLEEMVALAIPKDSHLLSKYTLEVSHRGIYAQSPSPSPEPAHRDRGNSVGKGGRIVSSRKFSLYERSHAHERYSFGSTPQQDLAWMETPHIR